jgi:ATP phosphoribosyltransferase regulatory subunit
MTADPPIRLPAGVRDFLPRAAARRRAVAERVMDVLSAWGYARIITPVFEVADVLERGLGADARAAAIRFVEPGTGEVVALRPDITPQVARLVATRMASVPGPLRLCYEGAVTRLAGARGQREILQAGIELIDMDRAADLGRRTSGRSRSGPRPEARGPRPEHERSTAADAEVLAVAAAALAATGARDVRLDVGHVAPVLAVLGQLSEDAAQQLRAALIRKDRARVDAIARQLPAGQGKFASALVRMWGPADAVLAEALAMKWPDGGHEAFERVRDAMAGARALLAGTTSIELTLDLGEVRGFDYYTGLRFAGYAAGAADAVLRGGRYDRLLARYGAPAAAIGFAVDIEALAEADTRDAAAVDVAPAVLVAGGDPAVPAIASALRGAGVRAAVDLARRSPAELGAYLTGAGYAAAVVVDKAGARRIDPEGRTTKIPGSAISAARSGAGGALARALGVSE